MVRNETDSIETTLGHFNDNLVAMICHAAIRTGHLRGFDRENAIKEIERDIRRYCFRYSSPDYIICPDPYIEYYKLTLEGLE